MNKMTTLLGLACVLALFTGCETTATTPVQAQRTQATINGPKDRVWPLIVAEIGLDYPVRAIEKDSGLLTTDWVTIPAGFNNMNAAQWIFPPGGFLATWGGLRMNMKVMAVETEPGKTLVTINCHYEAFESNVQKAWLVANSNGAVENRILTKLETRLATAPLPNEVTKTAPVATPSVGKSPADSLLELKKLLDAGAITPEEYAAKKKLLVEKL